MANNQSSLSGLLGELAPAIRIVDIGALWLGDGALAYRSLLETGRASVIGFEPIASECESLNQRFQRTFHAESPPVLAGSQPPGRSIRRWGGYRFKQRGGHVKIASVKQVFLPVAYRIRKVNVMLLRVIRLLGKASANVRRSVWNRLLSAIHQNG
jgi:hypothetical protein